MDKVTFKNTIEIPVTKQYYMAKDLVNFSKLHVSHLIQLQGGDNQNACCGGTVSRERSFVDSIGVPPHMLPPKGPMDERTLMRRDTESAEARKVRLTSGRVCQTLLDDTREEPLPPRLRRPGEPKLQPWPRPRMRCRSLPMPVRDAKYHEKLDDYLSHLPFFGANRYKRVKILKRVSKLEPIKGILHYGRCYIEKDWKNSLDPRMDPDTLFIRRVMDHQRKMKLRADGPINRIVKLFMEKVLDWSVSNKIEACKPIIQPSSLALLWLGPCLARKMLVELCAVKNSTMLFEQVYSEPDGKDFYMINRLAVDAFFSDKEAFYYMLKDYILSPSLTCQERSSDICRGIQESKETCEELEDKGHVTRRICTHQNLSLSLKPCMVSNCPNFKKPVCEHLYAFIPETITINSYMSMCSFSERFQRVEDLKGCIFITKPAYLCNGRGINFLHEKEQFDYFYNMLPNAKDTSRHGVILQRYIECPRLFDCSKFTIRFFLLIIVLPRRRVLAFIHYGLAIFCPLPYKPVMRQDFSPTEEALEGKEPNLRVPIAGRTIGRVVNPTFGRQVHLSNYYEPDFRAKIKEDVRTGKAVMMEEDLDNVFYLADILPVNCINSTSIYIQMLFAAQRIMDYMQPIIQDYPGTFQTVSVDSLVDARNKLWLLEAGTKIFSGLLTVAPRQRQVMSAIIQESLGVTIECFYKSHMNQPLYWNYKTQCEDYGAFYFAQDFNFFYETDVTKWSDAKFLQKVHGELPKRLEQRFLEVDTLRHLARERKLECEKRTKENIRQRLRYIARMRRKREDES